MASLLGWSAGTTVRMARGYGPITAEAQRKAVAALAREEDADEAARVEALTPQ